MKPMLFTYLLVFFVIMHKIFFLKIQILLEPWLYVCLQEINVCLSCHLNTMQNIPWAHHFATYNSAPKHHTTPILTQPLRAVSANSHKASALFVWIIQISTVFSLETTTENSVFMYSVAHVLMFCYLIQELVSYVFSAFSVSYA